MTSKIWTLILTKPRQERSALENLLRQGYESYLPLFNVEKIRRGRMTLCTEPLFPRYLFIRRDGDNALLNWGSIRSTRGVTTLVRFGDELPSVPDALIELLREREQARNQQEAPQRLFDPGDRVKLLQGPFAGLEAVYQMADGEQRAMVLLELMHRPLMVKVNAGELRKIH